MAAAVEGAARCRPVPCPKDAGPNPYLWAAAPTPAEGLLIMLRDAKREQYGCGWIAQGAFQGTIMSKHEAIASHHRRWILRDDQGQIRSSVEQGAALSADPGQVAWRDAEPEQGHCGDRQGS